MRRGLLKDAVVEAVTALPVDEGAAEPAQGARLSLSLARLLAGTLFFFFIVFSLLLVYYSKPRDVWSKSLHAYDELHVPIPVLI